MAVRVDLAWPNKQFVLLYNVFLAAYDRKINFVLHGNKRKEKSENVS